MTDVIEILNTERLRINRALQEFLATERSIAQGVHPLAAEVYDAVADFTLGPGKRLRPILMIMGYRAVGGTDEDAILTASCCLELTQSMLLIHDDIMDQSDLRRGRPTVHAFFAQRYSQDGTGCPQVTDAHHFGLALAIAAGDLAGQLALRALARAAFPHDRLLAALSVYTAMTRDVCYGQVLDMHAGDRRLCLQEQDILTIHRYKTARYTSEGPLHMGAVLAGADAPTLATLSAYALPLGQAFQLQDDLLGVFGREEQTGKPADDDLREGKCTLLVVRALEQGTPAQQAALRAVLGNRAATPSQIEEARRALEESGARRYCQERAANLAAEARSALSGATLEPQAKAFLCALVDYVVGRSQ